MHQTSDRKRNLIVSPGPSMSTCPVIETPREVSNSPHHFPSSRRSLAELKAPRPRHGCRSNTNLILFECNRTIQQPGGMDTRRRLVLEAEELSMGYGWQVQLGCIECIQCACLTPSTRNIYYMQLLSITSPVFSQDDTAVGHPLAAETIG